MTNTDDTWKVLETEIKHGGTHLMFRLSNQRDETVYWTVSANKLVEMLDRDREEEL